MPDFIPGLELSRRFYEEAVRPVLGAHRPALRYDAARIGRGSEVQGFDDETSTDHDWGPRLQVFVGDAALIPDVLAVLDAHLPPTFTGYPTRFALTTDDSVKLRVTVHTVAAYLRAHLAAELPLSPVDWVTCGDQALRELTGGAVFHGGLGELAAARAQLAYYPHNVWLYLMAGMWRRIGQEEHLMGRAGVRGDEIGAALIGARLVRDVMRLAFLIERVYAPYPKWFGTAFAQLEGAAALTPHLRGALAADAWPQREAHLVAATEHVARAHNALGVTEPVPATARPFFDRPFRVIGGGEIADALLAAITDPAVQRLPAALGGIDAVSDSTDVLSYPTVRARGQGLWKGME